MSGTLPPLSWLYSRTLHHIDQAVYRASRGRATFTSWTTGLPIVMLTTTGAKSGRTRTLPVLGVPNDGNLVVIASNYGQDRNPAWYHNLRAQPRASIIFEGERREVVARELTGERARALVRAGRRDLPGLDSLQQAGPQRPDPGAELRPVA